MLKILAGDFDDDTRLVLINAVYLKAKWEIPFKKENTEKKDFHVTEKKKVKVDMMYIKDHFSYGFFKELDADVLVSHYIVRS